MGGTVQNPMGRWRLAASLLIVLISTSQLTALGRMIKRDRSGDPLYSGVIGKEYKTKVDLVIFRTGDTKVIYLEEFGDQFMPKREEIRDRFPYKHKPYGRIILGILPADSVFKVARVQERGHSSATFIHYHAQLLSSENKEFIGKEIDPTYLTLGDPPHFEEKLVEEVK